MIRKKINKLYSILMAAILSCSIIQVPYVTVYAEENQPATDTYSVSVHMRKMDISDYNGSVSFNDCPVAADGTKTSEENAAALATFFNSDSTSVGSMSCSITDVGDEKIFNWTNIPVSFDIKNIIFKTFKYGVSINDSNVTLDGLEGKGAVFYTFDGTQFSKNTDSLNTFVLPASITKDSTYSYYLKLYENDMHGNGADDKGNYIPAVSTNLFSDENSTDSPDYVDDSRNIKVIYKGDYLLSNNETPVSDGSISFEYENNNDSYSIKENYQGSQTQNSEKTTYLVRTSDDKSFNLNNTGIFNGTILSPYDKHNYSNYVFSKFDFYDEQGNTISDSVNTNTDTVYTKALFAQRSTKFLANVKVNNNVINLIEESSTEETVLDANNKIAIDSSLEGIILFNKEGEIIDIASISNPSSINNKMRITKNEIKNEDGTTSYDGTYTITINSDAISGPLDKLSSYSVQVSTANVTKGSTGDLSPLVTNGKDKFIALTPIFSGDPINITVKLDPLSSFNTGCKIKYKDNAADEITITKPTYSSTKIVDGKQVVHLSADDINSIELSGCSGYKVSGFRTYKEGNSVFRTDGDYKTDYSINQIIDDYNFTTTSPVLYARVIQDLNNDGTDDRKPIILTYEDKKVSGSTKYTLNGTTIGKETSTVENGTYNGATQEIYSNVNVSTTSPYNSLYDALTAECNNRTYPSYYEKCKVYSDKQFPDILVANGDITATNVPKVVQRKRVSITADSNNARIATNSGTVLFGDSESSLTNSDFLVNGLDGIVFLNSNEEPVDVFTYGLETSAKGNTITNNYLNLNNSTIDDIIGSGNEAKKIIGFIRIKNYSNGNIEGLTAFKPVLKTIEYTISFNNGKESTTITGLKDGGTITATGLAYSNDVTKSIKEFVINSENGLILVKEDKSQITGVCRKEELNNNTCTVPVQYIPVPGKAYSRITSTTNVDSNTASISAAYTDISYEVNFTSNIGTWSTNNVKNYLYNDSVIKNNVPTFTKAKDVVVDSIEVSVGGKVKASYTKVEDLRGLKINELFNGSETENIRTAIVTVTSHYDKIGCAASKNASSSKISVSECTDGNVNVPDGIDDARQFVAHFVDFENPENTNNPISYKTVIVTAPAGTSSVKFTDFMPSKEPNHDTNFGYRFLGWTADKNHDKGYVAKNGDKLTSDIININDSNAVDTSYKVGINESTKSSNEYTFYAKYAIFAYKVTIYDNSGKNILWQGGVVGDRPNTSDKKSGFLHFKRYITLAGEGKDHVSAGSSFLSGVTTKDGEKIDTSKPYELNSDIEIKLPEEPASFDEAYEFDTWKIENQDVNVNTIISSVTGKNPGIIIYPTYKIRKYTVNYYDYNNKLLHSEIVNHGSDTTYTDVPDSWKGHHFTSWTCDDVKSHNDAINAISQKLGDVNGDGSRADEKDLELLRKYVADNTTEGVVLEQSDFNNDGKYDDKDVEILEKYLKAKSEKVTCQANIKKDIDLHAVYDLNDYKITVYYGIAPTTISEDGTVVKNEKYDEKKNFIGTYTLQYGSEVLVKEGSKVKGEARDTGKKLMTFKFTEEQQNNTWKKYIITSQEGKQDVKTEIAEDSESGGYTTYVIIPSPSSAPKCQHFAKWDPFTEKSTVKMQVPDVSDNTKNINYDYSITHLTIYPIFAGSCPSPTDNNSGNNGGTGNNNPAPYVPEYTSGGVVSNITRNPSTRPVKPQNNNNKANNTNNNGTNTSHNGSGVHVVLPDDRGNSSDVYIQYGKTVTFYDNEGRVISTVKSRKGSKVKTPDAPEVEGKEFKGWKATTDKDGNYTFVAIYVDSDGEEDAEETSEPSATTTPTVSPEETSNPDDSKKDNPTNAEPCNTHWILLVPCCVLWVLAILANRKKKNNSDDESDGNDENIDEANADNSDDKDFSDSDLEDDSSNDSDDDDDF